MTRALDAPRRSPARHGVGVRQILVLLALGLVCARGAAADESADRLLVEARQAQLTFGDFRSALGKYEEILALPALEARHRAAALWGGSECHAALGEWAEAEQGWDAILADDKLPAEVHARAKQAKARRAETLRDAPAPAAAPRSAEEEMAAREQRRRAETEALLDRAAAAYDARRFDDAYQHVVDALKLDPESPKAKDLLERVLRERLDRGVLLHSLLQWFQTVRSETFQRLRTRLGEMEEAGQKRQREGDVAGADLAFREALALLDRSEFRAQLGAERTNLAFWLAQVDGDGKAKGLTFPPEPLPPAGAPSEGGLTARFYGLLAETFAERDGGADPIRFHEFVPEPAVDGLPHRSLGPNAFASRAIAVSQTASSLSRARWAERWIRAHVGGDWPSRPGGQAPGTSRRPGTPPAPRLLERLEDVLFVQHTEGVQREVQALRSAFDPRPRPVQVDISVYAAGPGGTVRMATALRLPPPLARESGLCAIANGALIEELRRDVEHLEKVTLLGHAQLRLAGDVAARLEVTERTEAHPVHAGAAPPPLTLLGLDPARYGLFLDVYAEDLPKAGTPVRSGALSLEARVRLPLPSVVVRRSDRGGEWTRLPKFAETSVECDERLPHAGTLALFGLPNPFVDSAADFPDLVLLVGLRPTSPDGRTTPTPDPPPWQPPGAGEAQDYPLGALAAEVLDDMVMDGWPEDRGAAQPVAEAVAQRAREEFLAGLLARRARLPMPGGLNPVSVHDGLASLAAGAREQVQLGEAVAFLASQEAVLYEVDVACAEVDQTVAQTWTKREGVVDLGDGAGFRVPAALRPLLDADLSRLEAAPSAYNLEGRQVTRATQQVLLRRLAAHSITRQMRVTRSASDGRARLVPVPGLAEEGLLVQVRPWLEDDHRRVVSVRARAARLSRVESVPLKDVAPEVAVDVPRWFPLQDRSAACELADDEALLMVLAVPEDPARALLVRVKTRRLQ